MLNKMSEKDEMISIRCTPKLKTQFKRVAADFEDYSEAMKFFVNHYDKLKDTSKRRGAPFGEAEKLE